MADWTDVATADTYHSTRYDSEGAWAAATTPNKTNSLKFAQFQIENAGQFEFLDDEGDVIADASATTDMKNGVHEQALWLLKFDDWELRAGLQEQGVTKTDVIGETWGFLSGVPISPMTIRIYGTNDRITQGNDIRITK